MIITILLSPNMKTFIMISFTLMGHVNTNKYKNYLLWMFTLVYRTNLPTLVCCYCASRVLGTLEFKSQCFTSPNRTSLWRKCSTSRGTKLFPLRWTDTSTSSTSPTSTGNRQLTSTSFAILWTKQRPGKLNQVQHKLTGLSTRQTYKKVPFIKYFLSIMQQYGSKRFLSIQFQVLLRQSYS